MKVHLHGSHFSNNFGDTLLAFLTCQAISQAGHTVAFSRPNRELAALAEEYLGNKLHRDTRGSDCLVFHGGGYFGEPPRGSSLRWAAKFGVKHFSVALPYLLTRRPFVIVGVGVGPVRSLLGRFLVRSLVNRAAVVTVRDIESETELHEMGVKRDIHVYPDVVLGSIRELGAAPKAAERPHMVVHLGSWNASRRQLAESIGNLARELRCDVLLITDHEGDERKHQFCEDLATELHGCGVSATVHAHAATNPLLSIIRNARLVLTDKLHVGIVATAFDVPVLSVPVHPKTPRFYRQVGLATSVLERSKVPPGDFSAAALKAIETLKSQPPELAACRNDSAKHMEVLQNFLTNSSAATSKR